MSYFILRFPGPAAPPVRCLRPFYLCAVSPSLPLLSLWGHIQQPAQTPAWRRRKQLSRVAGLQGAFNATAAVRALRGLERPERLAAVEVESKFGFCVALLAGAEWPPSGAMPRKDDQQMRNCLEAAAQSLRARILQSKPRPSLFLQSCPCRHPPVELVTHPSCHPLCCAP